MVRMANDSFDFVAGYTYEYVNRMCIVCGGGKGQAPSRFRNYRRKIYAFIIILNLVQVLHTFCQPKFIVHSQCLHPNTHDTHTR